MKQSSLKTESLAFALLGAAHALALVKSGMALPQALALTFRQTEAPAQARGAIQDIAYRSLRQLGRTEALLERLGPRPVTPGELHALLCCALALLCPTDPDSCAKPPYEDFTVVDQSVTAAAAEPGLARAKGMVNAVLRRFLRDKPALLAALQNNPVARWSHPLWWIDEMRAAYPDGWEGILTASNRMPPLTLRINRRRTSPEAYLERLRTAGIEADLIEGSAVRLARGLPVAHIPGFAAGEVSVQDAAAQLAAPLLDLHDGMRVLDACAAPGGKSGHMLETANIHLLALDSDSQRLVRIEENLKRLHLTASRRCGDATRRDWWDGLPFDRILADVPCTASGIVRRHPDIRWLRRKEDAGRLAGLSASILDNLWSMLRPDGKLLFVTCSLWPRESELQAAAFERRHGALRLPAPGQLLPVSTAQEDHDGLFYALFQKPTLC
jgi:16S rRNA (cytosine967-C5)-methyltransferase